MADPVYTLGIEFVTGSYTNVTSRVTRINYERSLFHLFRKTSPDPALFELDNDDGFYSQFRFAHMRPGKRIRLQATYGGAALLLNNTSVASHFAQTAPTTLFDARSGCAISALVRINSFWSDDQAIAEHMGSGDLVNAHKLLYFENNKFSWRVKDGANNQLTIADPTTPTLGQTYHLTGTAVAGSYMALYRDGTLISSLAIAVNSLAIGTGPTKVRVGALGTGASGYRLAGAIDDLMIFNRALSPAEVTSMSGGGFLADKTGMAAHWRFDEGHGTIARNSVENGLELSFFGGTNVPSWTTALNSEVTYNLFSGIIDEISFDPELGARSLLIEAQTDMDRFQRTLLTTSLHVNINAASLFAVIMSECNVQSFASETILDTVPFAWYRDRDAANAIQELLDSGYYNLFIDGAGTISLKNRFTAGLGTVQQSYSEFLGLQATLAPQGIVNQSRINATPRQVDTDVGTVAWLGAMPVIPASGAIGFWLAFVDPAEPTVHTPVASLITPVASTDYYLSTNSDGTGADLTATSSVRLTRFGATAVCTIFNGAGTEAYLARFQLRGLALKQRPDIGARYDDSSSQALFGLWAKEQQIIYSDPYFVKDLASVIVEDRKNPRDSVMMALKNDWSELLGRQVGDLVAVVNSVSGINSWWSIQHMRHEITMIGGLEHKAMYDLEFFPDRPWLVLDHADYGKLDDGRMLAL